MPVQEILAGVGPISPETLPAIATQARADRPPPMMAADDLAADDLVAMPERTTMMTTAPGAAMAGVPASPVAMAVAPTRCATEAARFSPASPMAVARPCATGAVRGSATGVGLASAMAAAAVTTTSRKVTKTTNSKVAAL